MAGEAALGAGTAAFGFVGGAINNGINQVFAERDRYYNEMYNERAAQRADQRTRALYNDLYSIPAQMRQLKEAGLSPSIYASGGLTGVSGQTGAQGAGANGPKTNTYNIDPLTASQIILNEAQANNLNVDSNKKEAETTNLAVQTQYTQGLIKKLDHEITNLDADTKNKDADTKLTELKGIYQNFQNLIKAGTMADEMELVTKQLETAEEILRHMKEQNQFDESNYDIQKGILINTRASLAADVLLKNSQTELNKKQKDFLQEQINTLIKQREFEYEEDGIGYKNKAEQTEFYKKWSEKMNTEITYMSKRFKLDVAHEVINDVIGIANATGNIIDAVVPF